MEVEEILEIERDIMSKLSYANIKEFQSKENLISDYKHSLIDPITKISKIEPDTEYTIEEEAWNKYHGIQKRLLNLLMNEKDLVSNSNDTIRNNHPIQHHMKEKGANEENDMDHVIKDL